MTTDVIPGPISGAEGPTLSGAGEIHLWHMPADPDARAEYCAAGHDLLSEDEKDRYTQMKRPNSAARFLGGRVLMRRVLGHYMAQDPASIALTTTAEGKPVLMPAEAAQPAFSLSHSGGESILAVAAAGDIGVDIEARSREAAVQRIAKRFFSPAERLYLDRCGKDRAEKSLILWTMKEAVLKARGDTVWDGLGGISLTMEDNHIGWLAPPPDIDRWYLAAGALDGARQIAVAYRMPEDSPESQPLVFRSFRPGQTPAVEYGFVPEWTNTNRLQSAQIRIDPRP